MADDQDFYDVLGLQKDASDADIKKAYRQLSKKYHPDINKAPDAEAKFKKINEAYETLSDPQQRAAYDQYGKSGMDGAFQGGGNPFGGGGYGQASGGFGDFGDIFSQFFGGGGSRANSATAPRQGADLQYRMDLKFEEAIFGKETDISYNREANCHTCNGSGAKPGTQPITCPKCHGTGFMEVEQQSPLGRIRTRVNCDRCGGKGKIVENPCPTCHGTGKEKQSHQVKVTIPAGIEDGQQMRLEGQGEAGENGGPYGDLYIVFRVAPSDKFERDGAEIFVTIPISFPQAALGDELEVDTVHGPVKLKVPAGTQSGTKFRLKGKGAPRLHSKTNGDETVTVNVVTPKRLNDKQKNALKDFVIASGDKIDPQKGDFFSRFKEKFQ
ncbi:molecular chaperone DnaJ [Lapidilactobacillus luobeiensis]|uniref:molecular chaperone DnaJ n=1 Tax=Lapidilactobacillus luobeiensis TaxID=2950371 RepID=UPI0021C2AF62|nr:molecular chaperone DnaJ [Lapidilactobacillus luobeiensis]